MHSHVTRTKYTRDHLIDKQENIMARGLPLLLLLLLVTAALRTSHADEYGSSQLSRDFYRDSCPYVTSIVRNVVFDEFIKDETLPAPLLRLHFHDCFVQGCDGSILINSTADNQAEKDAPPNLTLHAFDVIDKIKETVEEECPGVVSCADIVALAARDGVVLAGGPYIDTQLGRRDSRSSRASRAVAAMPGHRMNVDELLKNFAAVNLTRLDLVTLSGAHTIGDAHCDTVQHRIAPNHDSTMASSLREKLNDKCRAPDVDVSQEINLDFRTKNRFDNQYFKNLQDKFGLLSSDQVLAIDERTRNIVDRYAADQEDFFREFRHSMLRMGANNVLTGEEGEIRRICSKGIVRDIVRDEFMKNRLIPAPLLRLHFHDCFVQGCDGSVLIDSTADNQAEKDAPPNLTLHGFDIIDRIKETIEAQCPGVVSCADILTLASRDGVVLAGGPFWPVDLGRRDSRTSLASLATSSLPGHKMNVNELLQNFAVANLTLVDLVTLAGAHTIGDASCGSVAHRIAPNSDPTMAPQLRDYLNGQCKAPNVDEKVFVDLDSSSGSSFDNHYFQNLQRKFGLLSSDQALTIDPRTLQLVNRYASDRQAFFRQFSHSMIRMGEAGVLTGTQGEIRRTCSAVN
ncbi:unnamed protein product [Closterium sp. Yama58-4]|nr:unnamed protein product [Closterium sp. Yama58-4]